jgi:hypothetical protein
MLILRERIWRMGSKCCIWPYLAVTSRRNETVKSTCKYGVYYLRSRSINTAALFLFLVSTIGGWLDQKTCCGVCHLFIGNQLLQRCYAVESSGAGVL